MAEKPERLYREREYNPPQDERAEWRRVARKHLGKFTGEVVLHMNDGEPLKVKKREVIKES